MKTDERIECDLTTVYSSVGFPLGASGIQVMFHHSLSDTLAHTHMHTHTFFFHCQTALASFEQLPEPEVRRAHFKQKK